MTWLPRAAARSSPAYFPQRSLLLMQTFSPRRNPADCCPLGVQKWLAAQGAFQCLKPIPRLIGTMVPLSMTVRPAAGGPSRASRASSERNGTTPAALDTLAAAEQAQGFHVRLLLVGQAGRLPRLRILRERRQGHAVGIDLVGAAPPSSSPSIPSPSCATGTTTISSSRAA